MTADGIKEYLYILLDMEKNMYIQEKTLNNMYEKRNSLCNKIEYKKPSLKKSKPDYVEYMLRVGLIFGIIGCVIGTILKWSDFWDSAGIFTVFFAPIVGVVIGLIVGVATGVIIGPIVATVVSRNEQSGFDSIYETNLKEYDQLIKSDNERVVREQAIKANINNEIVALENKYTKSKEVLRKLYSYNILNEKYIGNIIAISSFYQYFCEKRTYSLEFDPKTGDRGAYNIYNDEAQRGVIILQLGKILEKLDQVVDNQRQLMETIKDANKQINYLSNNIRKMSDKISSSIQEQTAIEAYNAERTASELRFMNTMNMIYKWH